MSVQSRRLRLALIAHDIHDYGGMERAFAELIRRLNTDYEIVVVSATLDESLRPLVDWRRVRTPTKPFALKFLWFFVGGGMRMLRLRADLVHVLGAIVPTRADIACIQFCHAGFVRVLGMPSAPGVPVARRANSMMSRWLAVQAERWCYRPGRLRSFGAVSAGVARELRLHYPATPVAITPNGVDVDRYRPDEVNRRIIRGGEGVRDQDMVMLFVGGDWDRKGLYFALMALGLARKEGMPALLWIVGSGDVSRFQAVAREAGVSDSVRFFGRQLATEKYFQAADLFVLPTMYETFSLVAYEAAATGLPVIATSVSGIDELLRDGIGGLVVERDAIQIASAFLQLWKNDELRKELGASGQRWARECTWEKAAEAVCSLYGAILRCQA